MSTGRGALEGIARRRRRVPTSKASEALSGPLTPFSLREELPFFPYSLSISLALCPVSIQLSHTLFHFSRVPGAALPRPAADK